MEWDRTGVGSDWSGIRLERDSTGMGSDPSPRPPYPAPLRRSSTLPFAACVAVPLTQASAAGLVRHWRAAGGDEGAISLDDARAVMSRMRDGDPTAVAAFVAYRADLASEGQWDPNAWNPNAWDPNAWDPNAWDPNAWDPNAWDPNA